MSSADRPLRVAKLTPAEIAEWDAFEAQQRPEVALATCASCRNRSGLRCIPLSIGIVPLDTPHRCAHRSAMRPTR